MPRLLRVACAAMVLVAHAAPAGQAPAVTARAHDRHTVCRLYWDPTDKFTRVVPPARARLQAEAPASTVLVNYTGFTPAARAAFQHAVNIWQLAVSSDVPMVVDADFSDLGDPLLLGFARSSTIHRDWVTGATLPPRANTWFAVPAANSLRALDSNGATSEISASFNSTANWYFGTDANPGSGQIDFVSAVLHELAHGLGFAGSGWVEGGAGSIGQEGSPYIYDVHVVDDLGQPLIDASAYPNSTTLAEALQSDALYWDGPAGVAANRGSRPRIFAPPAFQPGSSFAHLDEDTYPPGDPNSLMTPRIGSAEAIHTPGAITLGMLTDVGWGPTASVAIDRSSLQFGATSNGAAFVYQTAPQIVRIVQNGTRVVPWTATSSNPWLQVSPASGTGSAELTVSVAFSNTLPVAGSAEGTVTVTFDGAVGAVGPVTVLLTVVPIGGSEAPFGSFDLPADGASGITGSLPVTGWALDDIEVIGVQIWRDPVAGEAPGALVLVGDAVVVEGARPDVALAFPGRPLNTRAGWGYLLLTNVLPNQGNGTFTLHAIATDLEGNRTMLRESKTITCTNATATAPFGAIDTPAQGQTVSGIVDNYGWVLMPGTTERADVPGGGTVSVVIDGTVVGMPGLWTSRGDISAFFATGYSALSSTLAVHTFDSAALTNGVHTIAWVVTATSGEAAGIGSRYFTVINGAPVRDVEEGTHPLRTGGTALSSDAVHATAPDRRPITGRRGFDLDAPYRTFVAGDDGLMTVESEELDRVELQLGAGVGRYTGYLRTGTALGPLPIGSRLDPATGAFTWQPGVGFVGAFDLVFVRSAGSRPVARQDVRVVLNPKSSGQRGPQGSIDTPTPHAAVNQPFVIAGWAADMDQRADAGVAAVHVWAYPVDGAAPQFVGAVAAGSPRPDVAAVHGDAYRDSGYSLVAQNLVPGTYDLAVFAWSTVRNDFVAARVVRVTVGW